MGIQTKKGHEARQALLKGITELNDAVKVTLGPAGRIVVFRVPNGIIHTKDGVTVAREMNLPDPYEAIGADVAKSVAGQAVDTAGDGTTTATLLIQAIFEGGVKAIEAGCEPTRVASGIRAAVKELVGTFDDQAKKFQGGILEQFKVETTPELAFHVAKISANGDEEIAKVVSDAVLKVGVDGEISLGTAQSPHHQLEFVEGVYFDSGLQTTHPLFVNDPQRNRFVADNCLVFISDRRLSTQQEALAIMEKAIQQAQRNEEALALLIIANDIDQEALKCLIGNRVNQNIPVCAITSPAWGPARRDVLEDIALITDGDRIDGAKGENYSNLSGSAFGKAARVMVTQNRTVITGLPMDEYDRKHKFEPYVAQVRAITENAELHPADLTRAKQRLAYLAGGVAVVKVGGNSGNEVKERGFRVEDSIHATRAAVADGVVPGGGSTLLFAAGLYRASVPKPDCESTLAGVKIVLDALEQPIKNIASNAGQDGEEVRKSVVRLNEDNRNGYDAKNNQHVRDMVEAGIVDPLKVVRAGLHAAGFSAAQLLVTEVVIINDPSTPMNR